MPSVVTAPEGATSRPSGTTLWAVLERRAWSRDMAAGILGAIAFSLIGFFASGGVDLAPNTWVQIGLVVLGAGTAIALALFGGRGPAWGGATLVLFAALAALTYASVAWSVQPANSWLESNRTLSYLAAFATALMLARLAPGRWRALLGAIATAATVVCGYALLVKVFPGTLDPNEPLGRLRAPFGYWNAVGLMGALGIVPCLWAGARREGSPLLRGLAAPAIAVLVPCVLLSYSRGALVVAVIGAAVWFGMAPLRLRSALILGFGVAGGAAIAGWGLATRGISADGVTLATRTSAGHAFGLVIIVVLALTALAGFGAVFALDRFTLTARARRAVATGLIGAVALLPVAGVAALAASSRGLTGEVSHIWNNLTNPNGVVGDKPGRLVDLSNSRPHYWSLAIKLGEHHLLAGVGALGFATAQPSSPSPVWNAQHAHAVHAHGYLAETFADFGLLGLALSLALLVAWGAASARSLELRRLRRPIASRAPPDGDGHANLRAAEWAGLVALLAVVITFGFHSLIDWTWFIPGTAVPALAGAGWLVGRGPLSEPVERLRRPRQLSHAPAAAGAAALVVVIAVVAVWVIVQPLRSSDAYSAALTAAYRGDATTALGAAHAAAAEDPVSVEPLFLLSVIYSRLGDPGAARQQLTQAISRQPSNPQTWQQLGCYDYGRRDPRAGSELRRLVALQSTDAEAESNPTAFCGGA